MLEGKAEVGEVDMVEAMQRHALRLAAHALDLFDVTEPTHVAHFIKKVSICLSDNVPWSSSSSWSARGGRMAREKRNCSQVPL